MAPYVKYDAPVIIYDEKFSVTLRVQRVTSLTFGKTKIVHELVLSMDDRMSAHDGVHARVINLLITHAYLYLQNM